MKLLVKGMLCVWLILFSGGAVEAADMPKLLASGLQKWAEVNAFSCRFTQQIYFSDGGEKAYSGTLHIRRPGQFRWQYMTPYEQLYVSHGQGIWHYEPDLMQAQKLEGLDAVDPAAMRLLDGRIMPEDIVFLTSEKAGKEMAFEVQVGIDGPKLWLGFSAAGDLKWLESRDVLGNRNRVILQEISFDVPPMRMFEFVPPAGVDVVGE